MTLQQLYYAIEIEKYGSINQAAQHLFISQSSISIAIKELERSIGITIFQRSNRGVLLTQQGDEFLKHARALVERMVWLQERYQTRMIEKANFQISAAHYSFVSDAFVTLLNNQKDTDIHFSLRNITIHQVIQDVIDFRSDVGILYMHEHTKTFMEHIFQKNDLRFHSLAEITPHIFLRKQHPLAQKDLLKAQDLKPYSYIRFELPSDVSDDFCEELPMLYLPTPKQTITVNDHHSAMHLLAKTDMYTSGTGLMNNTLNEHEVVSIRYDCQKKFHIGWIVHKNALPSMTRQIFLKALKETLQEQIHQLPNEDVNTGI